MKQSTSILGIYTFIEKGNVKYTGTYDELEELTGRSRSYLQRIQTTPNNSREVLKVGEVLPVVVIYTREGELECVGTFDEIPHTQANVSEMIRNVRRRLNRKTAYVIDYEYRYYTTPLEQYKKEELTLRKTPLYTFIDNDVIKVTGTMEEVIEYTGYARGTFYNMRNKNYKGNKKFLKVGHIEPVIAIYSKDDQLEHLGRLDEIPQTSSNIIKMFKNTQEGRTSRKTAHIIDYEKIYLTTPFE